MQRQLETGSLPHWSGYLRQFYAYSKNDLRDCTAAKVINKTRKGFSIRKIIETGKETT